MRQNQLNFLASLQASGKSAEDFVDMLAVGIEDMQDCRDHHLTATEWRQCVSAAAKHRIGLLRPDDPLSLSEVLP